MPVRPGDEFQARGQVQLLQDAVHVVFDRARAETEPLGDLRVVQPLGHEAEHLPFARGEVALCPRDARFAWQKPPVRAQG